MRREVILQAAKRLAQDIESSGVDKMFEEAIERTRGSKQDERNVLSFSAFQKLAVAATKYTDVEHQIAKILGLEPLFDAEYWQHVSSGPDPGMIYEVRKAIHFATTDLPKIGALFRQENVDAAKGDAEGLPQELRGKSAITFILPEEDGQYSSPGRLIAALDAVTNLYGVECTLADHNESDLIVLAIDSGSDKSFDLLGLAKLMEEVRKLVISVWDRRVFYRHMQISQCIGLIAQSLPVIEKIEELKRTKAIEPEQAELLKRRTLLGVTQFLESGVYIDEMEVEGRQSARLLMRPEQKLLAAPTPTGGGTKHPHEGEPHGDHPPGSRSSPPSDLSDEDVAQLERLLQKAKQRKRAAPTSSPERPAKKGRTDT